MALKIDYKDDILVSEARKFNLIQNTDGTVSLEDVSEYQQVGDTFGAKDVNETNTAVNQINEKLDSFEQTKTDIVGSGLGTALGMSTGDKWADIVSDIKGVEVGSDAAASTYNLDATNKRVRFYIPKNGFWKTANFIYQTYANIANLIGLTAAKLATGVSVLGLTGTYNGLGNATADKVLIGNTFSSASLSNADGTMPNRGALNWSGSNTTYSVPAGYYSGGTLDSRPSYNAGVSAGKTNLKTFSKLYESLDSGDGYFDKEMPGTQNVNIPANTIGLIIIIHLTYDSNYRLDMSWTNANQTLVYDRGTFYSDGYSQMHFLVYQVRTTSSNGTLQLKCVNKNNGTTKDNSSGTLVYYVYG